MAGKIHLTALGARNLRNTEWLTKQDPYVNIWTSSTSERKVRTITCQDGGKSASWNSTFVLNVKDKGKEFVYFEVKDENRFTSDRLIGKAKVNCTIFIESSLDTWVPIFAETGISAGEINISAMFVPGDSTTPAGLTKSSNNQSPSVDASAFVAAPPAYNAQPPSYSSPALPVYNCGSPPVSGPPQPTYGTGVPPIPPVSTYYAPAPTSPNLAVHQSTTSAPTTPHVFVKVPDAATAPVAQSSADPSAPTLPAAVALGQQGYPSYPASIVAGGPPVQQQQGYQQQPYQQQPYQQQPYQQQPYQQPQQQNLYGYPASAPVHVGYPVPGGPGGYPPVAVQYGYAPQGDQNNTGGGGVVHQPSAADLYRAQHQHAPPLPPNWSAFSTPEGTPYYFNHINQQTTWTRPV